MTVRWILGISQIFFFLNFFHFDTLQAARREAYLVVQWEGRALEEPNLEALDGLRKKFPNVRAIHLINPSYFKEGALATRNLEQITRRVGPQDEVGLYLVPSLNLVKEANLIPIRKPTFWSYNDEVCTQDCGLQLTATIYNRSDVAKLFWAAHQSLKENGFMDVKSFAVHGWLVPAGLAEVAGGLGYRTDLTTIDPALVMARLKEYPIAEWLKAAPLPTSTETVATRTQAGGVLEFNSDEEILSRYEQFFAKDQERQRIFSLSVSLENMFMSRGRLDRALEGMMRRAEADQAELVFDTLSRGKNGRPLAAKVGISGKL